MHPAHHILIADDEPTIVELLTEILADEGYAVSTLPGAANPLLPTTGQVPTLIVLDVGGISGRAAARIERVRRDVPGRPPILLMSTTPGEVGPLRAAGAVSWLAKPFDLPDLLTCITRYTRPEQALEPIVWMRASSEGTSRQSLTRHRACLAPSNESCRVRCAAAGPQCRPRQYRDRTEKGIADATAIAAHCAGRRQPGGSRDLSALSAAEH
ncbi:MAG: response regulator transcription factor [Chloroflexales bacterium]|nr:response regulator transcription factor [Chloroflexales bacterium]